jgi:hypothetical protein
MQNIIFFIKLAKTNTTVEIVFSNLIIRENRYKPLNKAKIMHYRRILKYN